MASELPSVEAYKRAFKAFDAASRGKSKFKHKAPRLKRDMLATQYQASDHALTPRQISKVGGYQSKSVPAVYGGLASFLCKQLGFKANPKWKVLSSRSEDGRLFLHPQVVQAISELGWIDGDNGIPESEETEARIEATKAELVRRLKQSKFRKQVLHNFRHQCCLTGISEPDLLVASHIVPWKDREDSRLDPMNGLCLSTLYDRLFDQGYITFSDELTVISTPRSSQLSDALRKVLDDIEGKQASGPRRPINTEYLAHHRRLIFRRE
jgi:hypothetical protein